MIALFLALAALMGLGVGYAIGRGWSKVDAAESFDEGRYEGYMDGFQAGLCRRDFE